MLAQPLIVSPCSVPPSFNPPVDNKFTFCVLDNGAGEKMTTGLEFTDYSESSNHFLEATEMDRYDFLLNKIAARVINDDISLKAHLTEYEVV